MNAQAAKNKANNNAKAAEIKNLLNKQTAKNVRAKMNAQAAKNKANTNAKAAEVKGLLNKQIYESVGTPENNVPRNLSHEAYGNIKEPNMNNNEKNWSNWAKKGLNPLHNGIKSKQKPRLTKKVGNRKLVPKKLR